MKTGLFLKTTVAVFGTSAALLLASCGQNTTQAQSATSPAVTQAAKKLNNGVSDTPSATITDSGTGPMVSVPGQPTFRDFIVTNTSATSAIVPTLVITGDSTFTLDTTDTASNDCYTSYQGPNVGLPAGRSCFYRVSYTAQPTVTTNTTSYQLTLSTPSLSSADNQRLAIEPITGTITGQADYGSVQVSTSVTTETNHLYVQVPKDYAVNQNGAPITFPVEIQPALTGYPITLNTALVNASNADGSVFSYSATQSGYNGKACIAALSDKTETIAQPCYVVLQFTPPTTLTTGATSTYTPGFSFTMADNSTITQPLNVFMTIEPPIAASLGGDTAALTACDHFNAAVGTSSSCDFTLFPQKGFKFLMNPPGSTVSILSQPSAFGVQACPNTPGSTAVPAASTETCNYTITYSPNNATTPNPRNWLQFGWDWDFLSTFFATNDVTVNANPMTIYDKNGQYFGETFIQVTPLYPAAVNGALVLNEQPLGTLPANFTIDANGTTCVSDGATQIPSTGCIIALQYNGTTNPFTASRFQDLSVSYVTNGQRLQQSIVLNGVSESATGNIIFIPGPALSTANQSTMQSYEAVFDAAQTMKASWALANNADGTIKLGTTSPCARLTFNSFCTIPLVYAPTTLNASVGTLTATTLSNTYSTPVSADVAQGQIVATADYVAYGSTVTGGATPTLTKLFAEPSTPAYMAVKLAATDPNEYQNAYPVNVNATTLNGLLPTGFSVVTDTSNLPTAFGNVTPLCTSSNTVPQNGCYLILQYTSPAQSFGNDISNTLSWTLSGKQVAAPMTFNITTSSNLLYVLASTASNTTLLLAINPEDGGVVSEHVLPTDGTPYFPGSFTIQPSSLNFMFLEGVNVPKGGINASKALMLYPTCPIQSGNINTDMCNNSLYDTIALGNSSGSGSQLGFEGNDAAQLSFKLFTDGSSRLVLAMTVADPQSSAGQPYTVSGAPAYTPGAQPEGTTQNSNVNDFDLSTDSSAAVPMNNATASSPYVIDSMANASNSSVSSGFFYNQYPTNTAYYQSSCTNWWDSVCTLASNSALSFPDYLSMNQNANEFLINGSSGSLWVLPKTATPATITYTLPTATPCADNSATDGSTLYFTDGFYCGQTNTNIYTVANFGSAPTGNTLTTDMTFNLSNAVDPFTGTNLGVQTIYQMQLMQNGNLG